VYLTQGWGSYLGRSGLEGLQKAEYMICLRLPLWMVENFWHIVKQWCIREGVSKQSRILCFSIRGLDLEVASGASEDCN
jgi:hypothetical protein